VPEFELLRPAWLLLVPAGLLLALRGRRGGDPMAAWRRVVDPSLLPHLVVGGPGRGSRLAAGLAGTALALAGLALAGPSVQRVGDHGLRSQEARLLVLDVSLSMDAGDLAPSRMHRARRAVARILERPFDGLTGLVVFAGDAFTVTPLTDDVATVRALLPALDPRVVPVQGSRADLGLARAGALLSQGEARGGRVLLITDGAPRDAASLQAARLAARGFPVSVLGVGTPRGAPVTLPGGELLKDRSGAVVLPGLDESGLAALARAGGGAYVRLAGDAGELERLLPAGAGRVAGARAVERNVLAWQDQGYWLLLPLLGLGAVAFRRGWLLSVVLAGALPAPPAAALGPVDLWLRADQRAAAALARGDPDGALAVDAGPAWRGTALYRAGRYREAADAFARLDTADSHYNRGNALARAGRLEPAMAAYDAALARDPTLPDARFNRDLVRRLLHQGRRGGRQRVAHDRKPASVEAGREEAPGARAPDGEAVDRRAARSEQPVARKREDPAGTGTGTGTGSARAAREERAGRGVRAQLPAGPPGSAESRRIERWLRRIPDDPGGLLRRKFAQQYRGRSDPGGPAW
jgi:Ca-activated chloride channel family protein